MQPSPMPGADPTSVNTPDDLAACLDGLRRRRGLSYGDLEREARKLRPRDGKPQTLPSSTVSNWLNGKLPSREKFLTFLEVCRVSEADVSQWIAALERAGTADLIRPPEAVRVRDAKPRQLGVHPAIRVDGAVGDLPTYVLRDADEPLRAALTAASLEGGFLLLIGGSSVGKTRMAYEALLAEIPDWWLLHPASVSELRIFTRARTPRTVVWLDEIQTYLDNGLDAGSIRRLCRGKPAIIVIGTLWPDQYQAYTNIPRSGSSDPHRRERELLGIAEKIDIDAQLSIPEQRRAARAAHFDPRIAATIKSSFGMIRALAAAPELVRRWVNAPDRYAWAILTAAVDARRMGVMTPLTAEAIADLATGYLNPTELAAAPPDWLESGLAYGTDQLHGAASALAPVGVTMSEISGYVAADYLLEYALTTRRNARVPGTVWEALVKHAIDANDRLRLTAQATRRDLRRIAVDLIIPLANARERSGLLWMISLLRGGDFEQEAKSWRLYAGDLIDANAMIRRAKQLDKAGQSEAAATWYEYAALTGDVTAMRILARRAEEAGRLDEAAEWLHEISIKVGWRDHNVQPGWDELPVLLRAGRAAEAEQIWRFLIAADGAPLDLLTDNPYRRPQFKEEPEWMWRYVAEYDSPWYVLFTRGSLSDDEIESLLRRVAQADVKNSAGAMAALAEHLTETGRPDDAREWWLRAADAGDADAMEVLSRLLASSGDVDGAQRWLRNAADHGNMEAIWQLIQSLEREEFTHLEAEMWWRRVSDRGTDAVLFMAHYLEKAGRFTDAQQWLMENVGNPDSDGDPRIMSVLSRSLEKTGDMQAAEMWLRRADDIELQKWPNDLISLLERTGREEEAKRLNRFGREPGGRTATWQPPLPPS